jgi:hypothetical protein
MKRITDIDELQVMRTKGKKMGHRGLVNKTTDCEVYQLPNDNILEFYMLHGWLPTGYIMTQTEREKLDYKKPSKGSLRLV